MDLLQRLRRVDRSTKRYDWIALGIGCGQSSDQVRHPGAGRRDRDPSFPRHTTDTARNERGILLVSADDGFDFRVDERIENSVNLSAWDSEDMADTLRFKSTNNELRADLLGLVASSDSRGSLLCR